MKEHITSKKKLKMSVNCKINKLASQKMNINCFQNKEEKLFGYKSFLEIILGLIKNAQKNIITNKENKNDSLQITKSALITLNNDLLEIKNQKEKNLVFAENIRNIKITNYFDSKYSKNKEIINSDTNNLNNNFDSLKFGNDENESNHELYQLKALNFSVNNEIKKIENISNRMLLEIKYYKMKSIIKRKTKIFYMKNNDNDIINQILHNKLIEKRNKFIKSVNIKTNQEGHINFILDRIIIYRNELNTLRKCKSKKDVIRQNKKFYIETIREDTENDENSINNNSLEYKNLGYGFNMTARTIKKENLEDDKNNSNKDSTINEETNCNSCEKKESF